MLYLVINVESEKKICADCMSSTVAWRASVQKDMNTPCYAAVIEFIETQQCSAPLTPRITSYWRRLPVTGTATVCVRAVSYTHLVRIKFTYKSFKILNSLRTEWAKNMLCKIRLNISLIAITLVATIIWCYRQTYKNWFTNKNISSLSLSSSSYLRL